MSKASKLNQLTIKMCFTVVATIFALQKEVVLIPDIEIIDKNFSKNSDRLTDSQVFTRKTNPLNKNSKISKCNVCGSI